VRFPFTTAFLLCAVGVAVRLGWAELLFRRGSGPPTHRALRLLGSTPNATYYERLADLDQTDLDQETYFLRLALQQNPRLTSARIRLGLQLERRGDFPSAERTLLEAVRYDRQYFPAWTLANYYFRHENQAAFWRWSRTAAQLKQQDTGPILRLASLLEPDPVAVLARLEGGEATAYRYLDLLLGAGRLDSAQQVARVMLGEGSVRNNQLIDLSTRQLNAGNVSWALEIWNALTCSASKNGAQNVCAVLDPEHGPVLSRGVFEAPDGEGFHLRPASNPGVLTEWHPEAAVFSFEGTESDLCPLFEQPVPAPRRAMRYRLRYQYKGSSTGTRWTMADSESPALVPQEEWQDGEWIISVPPQKGRNSLRMLALRLLYRREPGTTPGRGEFALRNLQLTIF